MANYSIYLEAQDGELAELSDCVSDSVLQPHLARELLLRLGPYSPLVGDGKWISAKVTAMAIPGDDAIPNGFTSHSWQVRPRTLLEETQHRMSAQFTNFRAICNFTKGEYLLSREPYSNWLEDICGPGQNLLDLLITANSDWSWSECEIAVVPMTFSWMRRITLEYKESTPEKWRHDQSPRRS